MRREHLYEDQAADAGSRNWAEPQLLQRPTCSCSARMVYVAAAPAIVTRHQRGRIYCQRGKQACNEEQILSATNDLNTSKTRGPTTVTNGIERIQRKLECIQISRVQDNSPSKSAVKPYGVHGHTILIERIQNKQWHHFVFYRLQYLTYSQPSLICIHRLCFQP